MKPRGSLNFKLNEKVVADYICAVALILSQLVNGIITELEQSLKLLVDHNILVDVCHYCFR